MGTRILLSNPAVQDRVSIRGAQTGPWLSGARARSGPFWCHSWARRDKRILLGSAPPDVAQKARRLTPPSGGMQLATKKELKNLVHLSICACHPCAGAMLIFSVSFQFYRMIPEGNPIPCLVMLRCGYTHLCIGCTPPQLSLSRSVIRPYNRSYRMCAWHQRRNN